MEAMLMQIEARLEGVAINPLAQDVVLGLVVVRVDEDSYLLPELTGATLTAAQTARRIAGVR